MALPEPPQASAAGKIWPCSSPGPGWASSSGADGPGELAGRRRQRLEGGTGLDAGHRQPGSGARELAEADPDARGPPAASLDSQRRRGEGEAAWLTGTAQWASRTSRQAPGAQRAAAVLLGLGAECAGQVFRLLDEATIRQIALGARELQAEPQLVRRRWKGSSRPWTAWSATPPPATACCARSPPGRWGPRPPGGPSTGVAPPPRWTRCWAPVAQADTEALAMILAREQPQTVALVLASLDQQRAGALLKSLPERLRPHVLRRLATLESVAPEVLREVGHALQAELRASDSGSATRRVDGKAAAVALLRRCPPASRPRWWTRLRRTTPSWPPSCAASCSPSRIRSTSPTATSRPSSARLTPAAWPWR